MINWSRLNYEIAIYWQCLTSPIDPIIVCGGLFWLASDELHCNSHLAAETAARQVFELEPEHALINCGNYVILENI